SLLSVQKSQTSSAAESRLAINYGTYSKRIGVALRDPASYEIALDRSHWRKRFSEGGREKWLSVKGSDAVEQSAGSILQGVAIVLPELRDHSTDEALRDEWLSGVSPGIVEMKRLLYLAILINEIGHKERLESVVADLRALVSGGVHESLIERQLTDAGLRVSR